MIKENGDENKCHAEFPVGSWRLEVGSVKTLCFDFYLPISLSSVKDPLMRFNTN